LKVNKSQFTLSRQPRNMIVSLKCGLIIFSSEGKGKKKYLHICNTNGSTAPAGVRIPFSNLKRLASIINAALRRRKRELLRHSPKQFKLGVFPKQQPK